MSYFRDNVCMCISEAVAVTLLILYLLVLVWFCVCTEFQQNPVVLEVSDCSSKRI